MKGSNASSLHGNVVVLGRLGVLILGPSGSGKTRLCRLLVDRWQAQNLHSNWVADDRVVLEQAGQRTLAAPPVALHGQAELRGHGIENIAFQNRAVVDLVAKLVPKQSIDRMPEADKYSPVPDSSTLPMILIPREEPDHAIALIEAHIRKNSD